MAEKQDRVIVEMTIAAPVETVWAAMRDPEQMLNWFGWDAGTLKDEIQFIFFDHATADEANKVLAFGEYEGSADRIELREAAGGTVLRVVRSGAVPTGDWSAIYEDTWEGWTTFFQQLRFYLERHPGEKRRTIFLSGERQAVAPLPVEALGLGRESALTLPVGDASRQAWHRSRHQVGVTVPDWGDGLLVVTDKPAPNGGDYGGGSAVLTTFGLSDADFADIEKRWIGWWAERFPRA